MERLLLFINQSLPVLGKNLLLLVDIVFSLLVRADVVQLFQENKDLILLKLPFSETITPLKI
jgi:hypothetical protein